MMNFCFLPAINYYLTIVTFLMTFNYYSCLTAAGADICFNEHKSKDFFGIHYTILFLQRYLKPQFCFEN